jgi:hypothetical protein
VFPNKATLSRKTGADPPNNESVSRKSLSDLPKKLSLSRETPLNFPLTKYFSTDIIPMFTDIETMSVIKLR